MIWNNYIGTEFLVPEWVCENIIEIGEKKLKNGFGLDEVSGRKDVSIPIHKFESYTRSENFHIVNKAIEHSLREFGKTFTPGLKYERYSYDFHKFQKAKKDGGFYTWHCEVGGKESLRAFVWMLYLNTVNKGGNTEFYKTENEIMKIQPEVGKFVFWPAGETHYHRSSPDLKEDKYILTGWVYRK